MIDPTPLWDFDDPAGSEQRFREAAADTAEGTDRLVLMTQVARALGLQERYDEGHAVLDDLAAADAGGRRRASRSSADGCCARAGRPERGSAALRGGSGHRSRGGLDVLRVDALHMVALVAPAEDQTAADRGGARRGARVRRTGGPRLGRLAAQQPRA